MDPIKQLDEATANKARQTAASVAEAFSSIQSSIEKMNA
jgi:hypothetical protein